MKSVFVLMSIVTCYAIGSEVIPLTPAGQFGFPFSPFWDCKTQSLYFVDYYQVDGNLIRYDFNQNRFFKATMQTDVPPIFIIPIKGCQNQFAVGIGRSVKIIQWDGMSADVTTLGTLFNVEADSIYADNSYDFAKVGPKGGLWAGTYRAAVCDTNSTAASGSIYRYTKQKGVKRIIPNINVAGGFDWYAKDKKFYNLDTCANQLTEYDWNPKTLAICNPRLVYDFGGRSQSFGPLGMTVDKTGMVYVAMFTTGTVLKINPRKNALVDRIQIPAKLVGGLTFGGPDLKTLFVLVGKSGFDLTKAGGSVNDTASLAGSVLMVRGCGKGYPDRRLCLECC